jgi:hypothetical protein
MNKITVLTKREMIVTSGGNTAFEMVDFCNPMKEICKDVVIGFGTKEKNAESFCSTLFCDLVPNKKKIPLLATD